MSEFTAIITAHDEGEMLLDSFASVTANFSKAKLLFPNTKFTLTCVLDKADRVTSEIAKNLRCEFPIKVVEVSFGDLSESRNFSINSTTATWVAFLDADDIWGSNWVAGALGVLSASESKKLVVHPELNVFFGNGLFSRTNHVFRHVSTLENTDVKAELVFQNLWTALSAGARETYLSFPYQKNDLSLGVGFEDWQFNARVIEGGCEHVIAKQTVHFIREKGKKSMKAQMARAQRTTYPSTSFSNL